jgi:hypothetical protein
MPRDFSADGMDFLKVCLIRYCSSRKSIWYRLMLTDCLLKMSWILANCQLASGPKWIDLFKLVQLVIFLYRNVWIKILGNGTLATNCSAIRISPTLISAYPNLNWKSMNVSGDCDLARG